jgi:hypothetical protein
MAKLREGSEAIVKAHADRMTAYRAAVDESQARAANAKPTPTAEECDLIKLGVLDTDGKEDDGSGPERVRVTELREMPAVNAGATAEQQAAAAESDDRRRRR